MKTLLKDQGKGLLWLLLIYALVRLFFALPETGNQNPDIIAIVFGSLALTWLLFPVFTDRNGLLVSFTFFALSLQAVFNWPDVSLINLLAISEFNAFTIISIITLVLSATLTFWYLPLKTKEVSNKNVFLLAFLGLMVVIIGYIAVIDVFLPRVLG